MISKDDLDAATHDFINHLRSLRRRFKRFFINRHTKLLMQLKKRNTRQIQKPESEYEWLNFNIYSPPISK